MIDFLLWAGIEQTAQRKSKLTSLNDREVATQQIDSTTEYI